MIQSPIRTLFTVLLLTAALATISLLVAGCTDTLEGERFENKRPIVRFANIPPDGQTFSRNPLVYWYGTDEDGLIIGYRYHVVRVDNVPGGDPDAYLNSLPAAWTYPVNGNDSAYTDGNWSYLVVDPAAADPQTTQSIPLQADSANPVRGFVAQWVFLQAVDLEGYTSNIVYRQFSRNDNPPTTRIFDFASSEPFVNALRPGGVVTGIRLTWQGEDKVDYPTDPPPFEFQWRLYGPYDSLTYANYVQPNFFKTAFQSTDGFLYRLGSEFVVCDTTPTDTICDTYIVGVDAIPSFLGTIVPYFDIDTAFFADDTSMNKIAARSCVTDPGCNPDQPWETTPDCPCENEWVTAARDTIYNVFWADSLVDTTQEKYFVFWVRSRDDALVPDPSPAFNGLRVIDAKFERDVFVMDWTQPTVGAPAARLRGAASPSDSTAAIYIYWDSLIARWNPNIDFGFRDFGYRQTPYSDGIPLKRILQHKILVLYSDAANVPPVYSENWMKRIYKGIDAGVNCWVTGRAAVGGTINDIEVPNLPELQGSSLGQQYKFYFGVDRGRYAGWLKHAFELRIPTGGLRGFDVQDCMGGFSLQPDKWPDIAYDSARVANLYNWRFGPLNLWNPSLPYLPEVNWSEVRYGAEVMYLYKSHYGAMGASHPMGITNPVQNVTFNYNFHGAPMGHRYNTGLFRTVHWNFTPYALEQGPEFNALMDTVLNFLYDPSIASATATVRYNDAAVKLNIAEQRERYWRRVDMETLEKGEELAPEAMRNLRR